MIRLIQKYAYCIYLAVALGAFCKAYYYNWQFYATFVPVMVLVTWLRIGDLEEK